MTQFPYMPLYVDRLTADTEHMSAENFGSYMRLLCAMWRRGGWVPDNNSELARICRVDPRRWSRVRAVLDPLLIQEDGKLSQKRLLAVISDAQKRSSLQAVKASSRWHAKTKKTNGLADAAAYAAAMPRARALPKPNITPLPPTTENSQPAASSHGLEGRSLASPPASANGDNLRRRRTNDWDMPAAPGPIGETAFLKRFAAAKAGDPTALDPLPGAPEKPKKETRQ